jgi:hypothetical protein
MSIEVNLSYVNKLNEGNQGLYGAARKLDATTNRTKVMETRKSWMQKYPQDSTFRAEIAISRISYSLHAFVATLL